MQLRAEAPAKVNLALTVTGRRADGFHTLRSVFVRLALHDDLEVDVDEEAAGDSLVATGAEVDTGPANLILRAAASLRADVGGPLPPLRFRLEKRIPVAAGLGGGSSDGAAALDLAQAAWGVRLHPSERLDAALRLGADVPFFSAGHAACLVGGIGERLQPLVAPHPPVGILLVTLAERLSTGTVFAAFDAGPEVDDAAGDGVDELARLLAGPIDGTTLAAALDVLRHANDLWGAAAHLSPSLARARDATRNALGRNVLLTGSGPTLYAVYPSNEAAAHAADQLRAEALPELHGAAILATSMT